MRALLIKRWHNARRDRKSWLWQLFLPICVELLGIGLLTYGLSFVPQVSFLCLFFSLVFCCG